VLSKESGKTKRVNVADEVQSVITSLNSHPFVKRVVLRHGLSSIVVAYTNEQILDLKRFCAQGTLASLRSCRRRPYIQFGFLLCNSMCVLKHVSFT